MHRDITIVSLKPESFRAVPEFLFREQGGYYAALYTRSVLRVCGWKA
jgi:hypothetical protein